MWEIYIISYIAESIAKLMLAGANPVQCQEAMKIRTFLLWAGLSGCLTAATVDSAKEKAMKADLAGQVESMRDQVQIMVDTIFSFAELGFQEYETSKYI